MAIPVFIARVCPLPMTECFALVDPCGQTVVNVVFIRVEQRAFRDEPGDEGLDGALLDIGQHPDHHLSTALDHAEKRRLFLVSS